MPRILSILFVLSLAACSPPPELDVEPVVETPVAEEVIVIEVDWPAEFQRRHGSKYDPNSRMDREKMAALKGGATVNESLTVAPVVKGALTPEPVVRDSRNTRERILAVAIPLIGQTETQGHNRSPLIDKMNKLTGVPMGSPYCASFNAWCYSQAKAPGNWPKSAWSPSWVAGATWTSARGGKTPKPADAFGIWFASKGRIAHTGLIESWGAASAVTIEGNTSPSAEFGAAKDRDGDGIWRKRRMRSQIHSVRDWLGD